MRMRILYFGNNLSSKTGYYGTMDLISVILKSNGYDLRLYSNRMNIVSRLFHMIFGLIFNKNWCDLVLIEVFSTKAFNFAYILGVLSKILNLRYICILHGGNLPERYLKSPKKIKFLFQNAVANVAPSYYLYDYFNRSFPITLIPNALKLDLYDSNNQRTYNRIKLLYVRAIAEIYNPKMAVDVVKILLDKGYDVSLTLIGPDKDGTLSKLIDYINNLKLEDYIEITGVLSKKEWIKKSKDSNIFINTTNVDNTPVSVMEAMALGFPIISTNVGGIPNLISDGIDGILVDAKNTEKMANEIIRVFEEQPLRDKLVKNALKKVSDFDLREISQKWKILLDGL